MCTDALCISGGSETGSETDTNAEGMVDSNDGPDTNGDGDGDATAGDGDGESVGDGDAGDGDGETGPGIYCGMDTPVLTFSEVLTTSTPATYFPFDVLVADVAGDNSPEVIVGGEDFLLQGVVTGRVDVYTQTADEDALSVDPVFTWLASDLADPDAQEFATIIAVDLDSDFDDELLVLSRKAMQWYAHGDTAPEFAGEMVAGNRLYGAATGDFAGGGPEDVFYVQELMGWVGTYAMGTKMAGLELLDPPPEVGIPAQMSGTKVADLNGDSLDDVVLIETRSEGSTGMEVFSVLINTEAQGNAAFSEQTYPTAGRPAEIELFDVDGNATVDIVMTSTGIDFENPVDPPEKWPGTGTTESVHIFLNDGDGIFTAGDTYPLGDRLAGLAAADFDCDGIRDLMVSNLHGVVWFLRGDGVDGFEDAVEVFTDAGISLKLETADLNNDGRPDLVWTDLLDHEIKVAYQQ